MKKIYWGSKPPYFVFAHSSVSNLGSQIFILFLKATTLTFISEGNPDIYLSPMRDSNDMTDILYTNMLCEIQYEKC